MHKHVFDRSTAAQGASTRSPEIEKFGGVVATSKSHRWWACIDKLERSPKKKESPQLLRCSPSESKWMTRWRLQYQSAKLNHEKRFRTRGHNLLPKTLLDIPDEHVPQSRNDNVRKESSDNMFDHFSWSAITNGQPASLSARTLHTNNLSSAACYYEMVEPQEETSKKKPYVSSNSRIQKRIQRRSRRSKSNSKRDKNEGHLDRLLKKGTTQGWETTSSLANSATTSKWTNLTSHTSKNSKGGRKSTRSPSRRRHEEEIADMLNREEPSSKSKRSRGLGGLSSKEAGRGSRRSKNSKQGDRSTGSRGSRRSKSSSRSAAWTAKPDRSEPKKEQSTAKAA